MANKLLQAVVKTKLDAPCKQCFFQPYVNQSLPLLINACWTNFILTLKITCDNIEAGAGVRIGFHFSAVIMRVFYWVFLYPKIIL